MYSSRPCGVGVAVTQQKGGVAARSKVQQPPLRGGVAVRVYSSRPCGVGVAVSHQLLRASPTTPGAHWHSSSGHAQGHVRRCAVFFRHGVRSYLQRFAIPLSFSGTGQRATESTGTAAWPFPGRCRPSRLCKATHRQTPRAGGMAACARTPAQTAPLAPSRRAAYACPAHCPAGRVINRPHTVACG